MTKKIALRAFSAVLAAIAIAILIGLLISIGSSDVPIFLVMALAAVSFGVASVTVWRRSSQDADRRRQ